MTVAQPLTERILGRLPGPQAAWIAAWALVPWLNAGANVLLDTDGTSAVWEQSRTLLLLNYAFLSLAVAITLWGTGRIARRVTALDPGAARHVRELNGVAGPLACARSAPKAGVLALARELYARAFEPVRAERTLDALRGVVAQGAVGSRRARSLRFLRYEVRRWRDGVIPDVGEVTTARGG